MAACGSGGGGGGSTTARMQLSTHELAFNASVGGGDPGGTPVTISNVGGGTLARPVATTYYTTGSDWLAVEVRGDAAPYTLALNAHVGGLAAGSYSAEVSVAADGASSSPQVVAVTFDVAPAGIPELVLDASEPLTFMAAAGGSDPAARTVVVRNAGGGLLARPVVTVAHLSGAGWLSATVSGTAAPYTVTVQPRIAGLAAGSYDAEVTIASAGATGSPQSLGVTLTIWPGGASVIALSSTSVALTADVASTFSTDGTSVTVSNAGDGTLAAPTATISYLTGSGWLTAYVYGTAAPYEVTLIADRLGLALGRYEADVSIACQGAANDPAGIHVQFDVVDLSRTVTVTRVDTYWREDGTRIQRAPEDVSILRVTTGTAGVTKIYGSKPGGEPGTWTIAKVPPGPYRIAVTWADGTKSFYETSASTVDLGRDLGGRTDVMLPASSTVATFQLDGLAAWEATDALQLSSWDAGFSDTFTPWTLPAGATATAAESFDWFADPRGAHGIDPLLAADDPLRLLQVRETAVPATSLSYRHAVAAASRVGPAMASAVPVTIPATFEGTLQDGTLAVDWRTSQFEALLPGGFDAARHFLSVSAVPASLAMPSPVYRGSPTSLLELSVDASAPVADLNLGTLAYGRPLPAAFQEYRVAGLGGVVARSAPGAGLPAYFPALVYRVDPLSPGVPSIIVPYVGPPRGPTIAGRDARTAQSGVGTNAILAWSAPAVGTPSSYRVRVHAIWKDAVSGFTVSTPVAEFVTRTPYLQLPDGVLAIGSYVAEIVAVSSPWDDPEGAPERIGLPYGSGQIVTAPFSP